MPEAPRIAQPGDIFILLIPTNEEYEALRARHRGLQAHYGGRLVEPIHITVERFTPQNGQPRAQCVHNLKAKLNGVSPFPIAADGLIQFFAPYWQNQVLRWRVAETPAWGQFRNLLENTLAETRCPSHFTRRRHASCTILQLERQVEPGTLPKVELQPLFWAHQLMISTLHPDGQFETIETIKLQG